MSDTNTGVSTYLSLGVFGVVADAEHGALVAPSAGTVVAPHALVAADDLRKV